VSDGEIFRHMPGESIWRRLRRKRVAGVGVAPAKSAGRKRSRHHSRALARPVPSHFLKLRARVFSAMLKDVGHLHSPDPFYDGTAGFVGSTLEKLHHDMSKLELPAIVPEGVRRCHDAVRHAYIYSYFSYDLLTLAASQTFPCLELALRECIGKQFEGRTDRKGKLRPPPMLDELLKTAKAQGLISSNVEWMNHSRKMFAHGSDAVLNPPLFLTQFEVVTCVIRELYESKHSLP